MSQRVQISVVENIPGHRESRAPLRGRVAQLVLRLLGRHKRRRTSEVSSTTANNNGEGPRVAAGGGAIRGLWRRPRKAKVDHEDPASVRDCCCYRRPGFEGLVDFFGFRSCVDPGDPRHTRWLALVSLAVLYNVLFVVGRAIFWEMNHVTPAFWLTMDYVCDIVYLMDMIVHAHEGYMEQGMIVYDVKKRRLHYLSSSNWWYDLVSMLPTDIAYLWWDRSSCQIKMPCPVIVRINRLVRLPRMIEWFDRTETGSGYPNVIRICKVVVSLSVLIHWNACLYFAISYALGFGTDNWVYNLNGARNSSLAHQYIYSFYWSTLTLTTIGETPQPENDAEYMFVVADFLAGVLIFATIVGNIGSMISNMNVARVDFQTRMDGVKQYMSFRKVSSELEDRVIRWFDYIWTECGALDEEQVLSVLPDKLKAEIAISVHLETLQKVRIFQDCEPGLLEALVLKLRLKVFSPGDYICRKGDVGKEMYIVKRGRLSVVGEDGSTVFASLGAGSVFGEVSVLDIPGNTTGNRRTANVRSVGFSDLFCLAKSDLWEALSDYPEARATLIERGCQLLRKDGLLDERMFANAQQQKESPEEIIKHVNDAIDELLKRMGVVEQRVGLNGNPGELILSSHILNQSYVRSQAQPKIAKSSLPHDKKPIYYDSE